MGRAGAEVSLLELLKRMENCGFTVFLYVLMGQGELMEQIPPFVRLLNTRVSTESVLSGKGRRRLAATVLRNFCRNGGKLQKLADLFRNWLAGMRKRECQISKLLWRVVSDGAEEFDTRFDLAVAWLEGGSAYYVADHVKAGRKAAFIHIDYGEAGYTRKMDRECWRQFDRIFAVSEGVRDSFQAFYPEYAEKLDVFRNMIDREAICRRGAADGGFSDDFGGIRLLTVGRLDRQKGYDIAIEAMQILREAGYPVRWYVLGEGPERKRLERKIGASGLAEDFLLLGAVENPCPYYVQADIYVHATRFEGKSVAVQEALILGCAVVASDAAGNREMITDGETGVLCELTPEGIAGKIADLLEDGQRRRELGQRAAKSRVAQGQDWERLLELIV